MESVAGFVEVSCAAGSRENADAMARALVEQRLAACVHVTPTESHYRWQGELHHEPEFVLQARTTTKRLPAVEQLIRRMHSYELPGIAVTPIIAGSAAYLAWIADSVSPAVAV